MGVDENGDDRAPEGSDPVVVVPVEKELDLHSFAPRDVVSVVASYLDACREQGLLEVRVIHGRGRGVQRAEVRRYLSGREDVRWFDDAPPTSGGWGATLVCLHPRVDA